jgi:pimeloyl-ACP methyl ester carboxylesterase
MSVFVLIHGAWHGSWIWEDVCGELAGRGHTVVCPDLPAHGADSTPPSGVSLGDYVDTVAAAVRDLAEPAVLVGHSFGGAVISQAAEVLPERISHLVYLCAVLLRDGQSAFRHGLSRSSTSLLTPENLLPAEHQLGVSDKVIFEGFYAGCSSEQAGLAAARVRPEPLAPMRTPLSLGNGRTKAIPRTYIECSEDRIIPLADQRRMCRLAPPDRVLRMASGHSPFLTDVPQLVDHLLSVDRKSREGGRGNAKTTRQKP